jgi:hypothetical protein
MPYWYIVPASLFIRTGTQRHVSIILCPELLSYYESVYKFLLVFIQMNYTALTTLRAVIGCFTKIFMSFPYVTANLSWKHFH